MRRTKKKIEPDQLDLDERIARFYSYWGYFQGYLLPKWVENMVGREAVNIYYERYTGQSEHLDHFGCAIELEHRANSVLTLQDIRKVAVKITRLGYDFMAAAALRQELESERARLQREIDARRAKEDAEFPRRHADTQPDGIRMLRELRAKQLPQSAGANLAMIRTLVGLEKKE